MSPETVEARLAELDLRSGELLVAMVELAQQAPPQMQSTLLLTLAASATATVLHSIDPEEWPAVTAGLVQTALDCARKLAETEPANHRVLN